MKLRVTRGWFAFNIFNVTLLSITALVCLFPVIHVLALSLSSSTAAMTGKVTIWPVDFTTKSYEFVMESPAFIRAFLVSLKRIALGVPINMLLTIFVAYPLSKSRSRFRARNVFLWYFVVTMLFGGGLIPTYMVVFKTGLIDTIWALILPGAVPVFNVILLLNFLRGLPKEMEEAAFIDGAGHWYTLWKVLLPLCKPALATLSLFVVVGHWNSWFDGLIYMNTNTKYPLQSYLQTAIVTIGSRIFNRSEIDLLKYVNDRTSRAAEIFIAMVPILLVYPFLQRYFTKGIVLGSVKG
jgi:putative aldouronate transport system permease protein